MALQTVRYCRGDNYAMFVSSVISWSVSMALQTVRYCPGDNYAVFVSSVIGWLHCVFVDLEMAHVCIYGNALWLKL